MWKHRGYIGKGLVFLTLLSVCAAAAWSVLVPKFYSDNTWPTTSTYQGFYQMKKGTVDVLMFGSSHMASSVSPQRLYE